MFYGFEKKSNKPRWWLLAVLISSCFGIFGCAYFGLFPSSYVYPTAGAVLCALLFWGVRNYQTRKGVWIEAAGVLVKDGFFEIFFPWSQLDRYRPALLSGGDRLVLRLLSDRPGLGYVIKKARGGTDLSDLPAEESVIDLDGLQCTILSGFSGGVRDLVRKIELGRRDYLTNVEKDLSIPHEGEYAIALGGAIREKKQVVLREGVPLRFPQFCPFTGEDCDQVMMILDRRRRFEVPWLVSSKAAKQRQQVHRIQIASLLIPLLFYILYGYWVIFWMRPRFESDIEIIWQGFYSLSIFLITPIVRLGRRSPVRLEREKQDLYSVYFEDEDYWRAFVDLNQEK